MLHLSEDSRPAWSDGNSLPFGTLTFYAENTHELLTVYDGEDMGTPLDNPVVADENGEFPEVWLNAALRYGVKLEAQDGRLVYHVPAYRIPPTEGAFKYLDAQIRVVDGDGIPVPGAEITLTDDDENVVSGYADPECTIPHTNPVVADAGGLFPPIYVPDVEPEPEPGFGIDAELQQISGEDGATGFSVFGELGEFGIGSIDAEVANFGPSDEYTFLAIADIFDTAIGWITDFDLFVVKASGSPGAAAFTSITINGNTYLTADCASLGAFTGYTGTAGTATDGTDRLWWWPLLADLEDEESYGITVV
jgi:hypothetical protein